VLFVALVWATSRLALWGLVELGRSQAALVRLHDTHPGGWAGVSSAWLAPWTLFDSLHFIGIAQSGYTPFRAAFFPLYPFLLRALSGGSANENALALAGVLVSNVAFGGALWLLFCLTRAEWGEVVARRAVCIEAFFPLAAFGAAVYTESLFLLLSLGLFWCARRKKWALCALCGVLAGLTRNSGPLLCVALLLDRPRQTPPSPDQALLSPDQALLSPDQAPLFPDQAKAREGWRGAACALCPLLAFVAVQWWLRAQLGPMQGLLETQKQYGRVVNFPWMPIYLDARTLLVKPDTWLDFVTFPQLAASVGTFALLWMYRRRFSAGKLFYVGSVLLASLTLSEIGEPHTMSTLRYLFGAFPAAQLLALWSAERLRGRAMLAFVATLVTLFCLHTFLFGTRGFLG